MTVSRVCQFVNEVKGGMFPGNISRLSKKDSSEAMENGPMAGFPLDSLKVILKDGSYHPVDSDSAFV